MRRVAVVTPPQCRHRGGAIFFIQPRTSRRSFKIFVDGSPKKSSSAGVWRAKPCERRLFSRFAHGQRSKDRRARYKQQINTSREGHRHKSCAPYGAGEREKYEGARLSTGRSKRARQLVPGRSEIYQPPGATRGESTSVRGAKKRRAAPVRDGRASKSTERLLSFVGSTFFVSRAKIARQNKMETARNSRGWPGRTLLCLHVTQR